MSQPTFSFGSGTGGSKLFGANSSSSGIFGGTSASTGQTPTTTAGSTGGMMGSNTLPAPSGMFGGGTSASTPSASIFGAGSKPTSGATTPSIFGNTTGSAGGLFGGNKNTTTTTSAPSSNMFGATSGASSFGGGMFGQPAKKDEGAAPSNKDSGASQAPPLFGGFSTGGSAPSFGASAAPSGLTTPATNRFSLGNSTTPAGPPPTDQGKATGNNLFGGLGGQQSSSNLFGAAKLSDSSSTSTPKSLFPGTGNTSSGLFGGGNPSGGGLFSGLNKATPAAASTSAAGTTSASSETPKPPAFSFNPGTPVTTTPSTQAASNAPAASSPFNLGGSSTPAGGASNLFAPKTTPASATPVSAPSMFGAANTSSATPKSLFGGLGTTSASTPTSITSTPSTTAPAAGSSLFGNPTTQSTTTAPASTTSTTTATTAAPPASGTGTGTASNAQSNTNPVLGASTMGPPPALVRLKNKTMDEIITRWASDLSKYQKDFQEQALKVASWDRLMVDNGEKIQKLYITTHEAKSQAAEIEKQLTNVEQNQAELESWLDRYEAEVDEMFSRQVGQGDALQGPDQERERTYKLAEKLTDKLGDMGNNLTSMIEAINEASSTLSKTSKADDPLSHIVRVLNSHLTQLQWIDENASALQTKVAEAQKMGQSFGPNRSGGPESDAAESFYRSFTGRR